MRLNRIVLSVAIVTGCGFAAQESAFAQEHQGTFEQQMACTPDVFRLCGEQIPDENRIVACLRQNTPQLSRACRAVFETNASMTQPVAPRRDPPPRVYSQPGYGLPPSQPGYSQPGFSQPRPSDPLPSNDD